MSTDKTPERVRQSEAKQKETKERREKKTDKRIRINKPSESVDERKKKNKKNSDAQSQISELEASGQRFFSLTHIFVNKTCEQPNFRMRINKNFRPIQTKQDIKLNVHKQKLWLHRVQHGFHSGRRTADPNSYQGISTCQNWQIMPMFNEFPLTFPRGAVVGLLRQRGGRSGGGRSVCGCLLYTSPSPRDCIVSRMPSSA